ncbi:ice-binding family protein [Baekduia sp. Peel2402]|uniref:ice-binding family protein n=1 Tax=Baekduia sp. Peel2402 TaxID=3458296 RepID=UPI00403EADB3
MSRPIHRRPQGRAWLLAVAAAGLTCLAAPSVASASPVDLGTVKPFVALAGATVTNTGPSVLNGELGVTPGSALVGFGLPAVVNGATHATDGVAAQAQSDLTTAYDVAAGQPVAPADDLTGIDLGGLVLTAGAYRYTSSAQLTGALVLDAQGDPNAQFVFEIATSLTTASASSVLLVNGASPCNVYWQVGSSATLGSTTAFKGNLMALSSISLDANATVIGRVLARNGQISLIDNVLDASGCGGSTTSGKTGTTGTTGTSDATAAEAAAAAAAAARDAALAGRLPVADIGATPAASRRGTATLRRSRRPTCADGFTATVRGRMIKRVVFTLDGHRLATVGRAPFRAAVRATPGAHRVRARITFTDATRSRTVSMAYRACAAAVRNPATGPSQFTG